MPKDKRGKSPTQAKGTPERPIKPTRPIKPGESTHKYLNELLNHIPELAPEKKTLIQIAVGTGELFKEMKSIGPALDVKAARVDATVALYNNNQVVKTSAPQSALPPMLDRLQAFKDDAARYINERNKLKEEVEKFVALLNKSIDQIRELVENAKGTSIVSQVKGIVAPLERHYAQLKTNVASLVRNEDHLDKNLYSLWQGCVNALANEKRSLVDSTDMQPTDTRGRRF